MTAFRATDTLEASSQYLILENTVFSQTGHWPRSQAIRAEAGLVASDSQSLCIFLSIDPASPGMR